MSRPTLPFDLPLDHVQVRLWSDPLVDALGHEIRSTYVERFWLAILGPASRERQNARRQLPRA